MIYRHAGTVPSGLFDAETVSGWAVFTVAGAIHSGYNVSSITDNAAGDWTVNWTVPFASTGYAVVGCTRTALIAGAGRILCIQDGTTIATTSARVAAATDTGALGDPTDGIYVLAIGRR